MQEEEARWFLQRALQQCRLYIAERQRTVRRHTRQLENHRRSSQHTPDWGTGRSCGECDELLKRQARRMNEMSLRHRQQLL